MQAYSGQFLGWHKVETAQVSTDGRMDEQMSAHRLSPRPAPTCRSILVNPLPHKSKENTGKIIKIHHFRTLEINQKHITN